MEKLERAIFALLLSDHRYWHKSELFAEIRAEAETGKESAHTQYLVEQALEHLEADGLAELEGRVACASKAAIRAEELSI
jgi:hypothetical protein